MDSQGSEAYLSGQRRLITMLGCVGVSESSLGAHEAPAHIGIYTVGNVFL